MIDHNPRTAVYIAATREALTDGLHSKARVLRIEEPLLSAVSQSPGQLPPLSEYDVLIHEDYRYIILLRRADAAEQ